METRTGPEGTEDPLLAEMRRLYRLLSGALPEGDRPVPDVLTIRQFARSAGLSEYTVQKACREGRIEAHKTSNGRHWRIDGAELIRFRRHGYREVPVTAGGRRDHL